MIGHPACAVGGSADLLGGATPESDQKQSASVSEPGAPPQCTLPPDVAVPLPSQHEGAAAATGRNDGPGASGNGVSTKTPEGASKPALPSTAARQRHEDAPAAVVGSAPKAASICDPPLPALSDPLQPPGDLPASPRQGTAHTKEAAALAILELQRSGKPGPSEPEALLASADAAVQIAGANTVRGVDADASDHDDDAAAAAAAATAAVRSAAANQSAEQRNLQIQQKRKAAHLLAAPSAAKMRRDGRCNEPVGSLVPKTPLSAKSPQVCTTL